MLENLLGNVSSSVASPNLPQRPSQLRITWPTSHCQLLPEASFFNLTAPLTIGDAAATLPSPRPSTMFEQNKAH